MNQHPQRTFYRCILLVCLSLAFAPVALALEPPTLPAAAPATPFIKARLDQINGTPIADERWAYIAVVRAYEWIVPPSTTALRWLSDAEQQQHSTRTLTGSETGYVRLWDNKTAALLWETRPGKTAITGLTFIDKTSAAAIVGQDLIVLNLADGKELRRSLLPPCPSECSTEVHFIADRLFTITTDNASSSPTLVRLWSNPENKIVHTFQVASDKDATDHLQVIDNLIVIASPEYQYGTDPRTIELWSLSDGHKILTVKTPTVFNPHSEARKAKDLIISPDNAYAVWITADESDSESHSEPSVLSLFSLSKLTELTLSIPTRSFDSDYIAAFSPDKKTLAVAYTTNTDTQNTYDAIVLLTDITDDGLKNLRTHTLAMPATTKNRADDDGDPMTFFPEVASLTFSDDNANLFVAYDYVHYGFSPEARMIPDEITTESDAITLTVATAKPNKTKPPKPKPATESPSLPYLPAIPPADFEKKYFTLGVIYPFVAPNSQSLGGLSLDNQTFIWSLTHPPLILPPNYTSVFGPDTQVYDIQHPEDCEGKPPQDGSIGVWDLKTQSHQILHKSPRLFIDNALLLPDGQLLICSAKYREDLSACTIKNGLDEYAATNDIDQSLLRGSIQLARFNPADKTLTPILTPPELTDCIELLPIAPSNRIAFRTDKGVFVHSLSDNKTLLSLPKADNDYGYVFGLSPNGQFLVRLQSIEGVAKPIVYDVASQTPLFSPDVAGDHNAEFIFSPDSKRFAFITKYLDKPSPIHVFDIASKSLIASIDAQHTDIPLFSPDGLSLILARSADLRSTTPVNTDILVIDIVSKKTLKTLTGHAKPLALRGLAFSPDGKTLFSVQEDGVSIAWDWTAIAASLAAPSP